LIAVPTDVGGVSWASKSIIVWNWVPCADYYNIYKRTASLLPDSDGNGVADSYGSCDQMDQPDNMTADSMIPPSGMASFYMVTAENPVGEGSLGYASNGHERPNLDRCP
jgi:hypothetical protein